MVRKSRSRRPTKMKCKTAARAYSAASSRARNAKERMLKACRTYGHSRQKRKSKWYGGRSHGHTMYGEPGAW